MPIIKSNENKIYQLLSESKIEVTTMHNRCTVVTVQLKNGLLLTENATCLDENNYNEKIGMTMCMKKIKEKLSILESYRKQWESYNN